MIFVDTGAWYAAYVASDAAHASVAPLVDSGSDQLVTTDLVMAESLNLLQARREFDRALLLGEFLFTGAAIDLVIATAEDLQRAFVLFSSRRGQGWSFTDCTSLIVMQRLGIKTAIALDRHFRQMPGITTVP